MDRPQLPAPGAHLRLVVEDGKPVAVDPVAVDHVPMTDIPEETLYVSFEGITEEEQHAALAGFPGGKRFVLVPPPAAARRAG
jgi:hypothetical protein